MSVRESTTYFGNQLRYAHINYYLEKFRSNAMAWVSRSQHLSSQCSFFLTILWVSYQVVWSIVVRLEYAELCYRSMYLTMTWHTWQSIDVRTTKQSNKQMHGNRLMSADVDLPTTSEHSKLNLSRILWYKFHVYIIVDVRCQTSKNVHQLIWNSHISWCWLKWLYPIYSIYR